MKKPFTESLRWWSKYIQRIFFSWAYEADNQIVNKDWVGVKIQSSYYPQGFPKNNPNEVFAYLEKEWKDKSCVKRK